MQFIGLNTRDLDPAPAKKFVAGVRGPVPEHLRPERQAAAAVPRPEDLAEGSIPTTLVIDKQGKVAGRVIGEVTKQTLLGMVKDAG